MDFNFSNLLGAPYLGGSILFDGTTLLSPIGNRVQSIDLLECRSRTLSPECLYSIRHICLSPDSKLILIFDIQGRMMLINAKRESVLHHMKFKDPVRCARFSPDGRLIAIATGTRLQIWKKPALAKQLAPMCLYRSYNHVSADITSLDWTLDSFGVAIGGRDMTTRIFTVDPVEGYKPGVLGGHRGSIIGVFFTSEKFQKRSEISEDERDKSIHLITVCSSGNVCEWSYDRPDVPSEEPSLKRKTEQEQSDSDNDMKPEFLPVKVSKPAIKGAAKDWRFHKGRWIRCRFHSFGLGGKTEVASVDYSKDSGLMVAGFSNGVFELIQLPGFHKQQVLSVTQERLTSVKFSDRSDWIAVGCAKLGQLLVWDWRSETQILKQQGHSFGITAIGFSPDGSRLVTGAEDAKIKVFSMFSGFCTCTFTDHLMSITATAFLPNGNAVLSSSLDGTVRAFDLVRNRNFRTFSSPDPVQFGCLAVDPKGEFVAAGSLDSFQIFVWSIKTAKLLDILAAHEGPVSALMFNPLQPVLGSSSWDKTVKLWDVFGTARGSIETLLHSHDVTTFTFRPDGKQIAAAALDGSIHFWDASEGQETKVIEGRRDISRGRFQTDARIATPFSTEALFTSLAYSADGCILFAAGKSKWICLYDVINGVLLHKIQTSRNKSLDGVLDMLNSREQTEAGILELVEDEDSDEDELDVRPVLSGLEDGMDLPGSTRKRSIVQTKALALCPTGQKFAAATTEGVLMFSLDSGQLFDPIDLEEDVTPQAALEALTKKSYRNAILISLRLRDVGLVERCMLGTPIERIQTVAREIPSGYSGQMLDALSESLRRCPEFEVLMVWANCCCNVFGKHLLKSNDSVMSMKRLRQVIGRYQQDLGSVVQSNLYTMEYILSSRTSDKMDTSSGG